MQNYNYQKAYNEVNMFLDSIPAMIFYKDKENNFIRVNNAFCGIMQMTKEQLEARSLFDIFPNEQAQKFWEDDKEILTTEESKRNIVEPMNTTSGETLWVKTDKILYRDENNNIIGIIGFAIDITDTKTAQDELLTQKNHLESLNKLMVGRELKMAELKEEIRELKSRL